MMIRVSQPRVAPVDRIVNALNARLWQWDDDRARDELAVLDDEDVTVLGKIFRHALVEDFHQECADPLGILVDAAYCYLESGPDREIAERMRDCLDEDLHSEILDQREAECRAKGGAS